MTEPQAQTIDEMIRARRDRDAEDDPLRAIRERVAAEEGIPNWAEECRGGNERQIRDSALDIRARLGLPNSSPTFESALAAQRRAQAERNARLNH